MYNLTDRKCHKCPQNMYINVDNITECLRCSKEKPYFNMNEQKCSNCPIGSILNSEDFTQCLTCAQ